MRRKANPADIMYIEKYHTLKPLEEISQDLDLAVATIKKHVPIVTDAEKRKKRLGQSKVTLKDGTSVYQMSSDIDVYAPTPSNDRSRDIERGIYRPEE